MEITIQVRSTFEPDSRPYRPSINVLYYILSPALLFCIYTKLLLKEKKYNAPYTTDENPAWTLASQW